jgi:hypothetical protein
MPLSTCSRFLNFLSNEPPKISSTAKYYLEKDRVLLLIWSSLNKILGVAAILMEYFITTLPMLSFLAKKCKVSKRIRIPIIQKKWNNKNDKGGLQFCSRNYVLPEHWA